ncbi:bile salt-activated lipase-like [Lethenteron reissneri]|uniref:bile salt-activated lipase-like n=1 Tax=Lethenteron reissneri TaxID=7753 RepID=UPI002AB6C5B0|nr:bile salt-activated lipase-like [Lethenteron reissneri]
MAGSLRFAVLVLATAAGASAASLGVVTTEWGNVEGRCVSTGLLSSVDVFKGIPFAAPPRPFSKPEPHPGWGGTLKAYNYRDRCLQTTMSQTDTRGSEDCLYLNVWVPHGIKVSRNLPVMVWIYGGAFIFGSSEGASLLDNFLYDGQELADRGKVIVVTFNYRLGPLGFLSTGDEHGPGNYGLWDQHAAIKWVKRNIRAFGGDPDNITIFGESAGGASVSLQMLSPVNNGIFHRAISQSGSALASWAIQRDPLSWAIKVAEVVGCPTDDSARLMGCLRISNPVDVVHAIKIVVPSTTGPLVNSLAWSPVVDGDFLPEEPHLLVGNAAQIDYMAGVNNMDGHLFAGADVPSVNTKDKTTRMDIYKLAMGFAKGHRDVGLEVSNLYSHDQQVADYSEEAARAAVELETDFLFIVPCQRLLRMHSQRATGARTYSYQLSHPSRMPFVYPDWMGADHADDLQYVFGKPFQTPLGYRPKDRDVSAAFIAYWSNFAKTGDPNYGGMAVPTHWPVYDASTEQYLDITSNIDYSSIKQHLRRDYMDFWIDVNSRYHHLGTEGPSQPATEPRTSMEA